MLTSKNNKSWPTEYMQKAKSKNVFIFLLFAIVITAIMSPIASHEYTPTGEANYHLYNIIQAREAILKGSFLKLQVAPSLVNDWLYPLFQFYSPSAYTISGYLHIIFSHNPLDAFKFSIGFVLIIGAWYLYKLYIFLFRNEIAALLGAVLYLFSPYLFICINISGGFCETIAQGLLPICLYYSFRLFYKEPLDTQKYYFIFLSTFSFYLLATSHLITFIYSSLFIFMLFFLLSCQKKNFKNILFLLIAYGFSIILALWYFTPIIQYQHIVYIGAHQLFSPWIDAPFTHLSTLLSPTAINPFPSVSNQTTWSINPGIGLPIIIAVCYWFHKLSTLDKNTIINCNTPLIKIILIVFFINFIMLWSPINFWKYLPHEFYVIQFTFRLLTDVMWLGGLLFVAFIIDLAKNKLNEIHLVIGIFLIAISGALWMYNTYYLQTDSLPMTITDIKSKVINIHEDYIITPELIATLPNYSPEINQNLLNVSDVTNNCKQEKLTSTCSININTVGQYVQLPILYYPNLLSIKVNGQTVKYYPSITQTENINSPSKGKYILATVYLTQGHYTINSQFVGITWANRISMFAWFIFVIVAIYFLLNRKNLNQK